MDLKDKTALVTGGGSGIGKAIALALAREGCQTAICGRNEDKLRAAAAEFTGEPAILTKTCDVSDREGVNRLVAWAVERLGRLDIVVNSAGINIVRRKMSELDPADFDRIMAVNATGFFNVVHAVLPGMRQQKDGLIVNVSSVAGKRALPIAGVAYAASKFAATAIGTEIGLEERDSGIRVTNVYPGEVNTPLIDKRPEPVPEERKRKMVQPEDIAQCVITIAKLPPCVSVPELAIRPVYQEYL